MGQAGIHPGAISAITARNEGVLDPDLPRGHMTDSERRQASSKAEASTEPVPGTAAMAGLASPRWNQWNFIDALGEGIYGIDAEGRCTVVNRAALEMLGYASADELLGRNMHDLIHHTHPDGTHYPKASCPLLHTLVSGRPVRLSNEMLWRKDGTPFIAEYSSFPIAGEGSAITGSVVTFNDASLRRNAEKRLAVQYMVSQVLAGSADLGSAPTLILAAIGAGFGWDVGAFWLVEDAGDDGSSDAVLRCAAVWGAPNTDAAGGFLTLSKGLRLERGTGLPGRAWAKDEAVHIADLPTEGNLPRHATVVRAGLRTGFAFPVKAGKETVGVIEFFSRSSIELDGSLQESITMLGQQVGQFLKRRRVEDELRGSEALKGAILQSALDCVVTIDGDSRILEFNPAAEQTFGYARSMVLGQGMAELIIPPEYREMHHKGLARYLATGEGPLLGRRIEVEAIRADGSRFPVELAITPTEVGGQPRFTAYLRDVTERKRSERDLVAAKEVAQEAEKHLQLALRSGRIGTWSWDLGNGLVDADARVREIFGFDEGGPISIQAFFDRMHPEDPQRVAAAVEAARQGEGEYEVEFRVVLPPSGELRWVMTRGIVTKHADGPATGITGTTWEITERRRTEDAVREGELRLRLAVEAADIGIWDFDPLTGDLRWDARCKVLFGLPPDAHVSYEDAFLASLHPDDREATDAVVQATLAPDGPGSFDIEFRTVGLHDGIERWVASKGRAVLEDGRVVRFTGTIRDVTARMAAERALRDSQERLRAALLASRTGTFRWDLRGDAFEMDEGFERLLGLSPGQAPRGGIVDVVATFVHPDDRTRVTAEVARIAAEGGETVVEYRVIRADSGVVRWLSARGEAARGPDGQPLHMIGAVVDTTERRRFEEELVAAKDAAEEANRAKSTFIANMSHELRTPLSAIIGYSEMLQEEIEDSGDPAGLANDMSKIEGNARHLLGLINDVLDLSKVESGKMEVYAEDFDADAVVREVASTVQALMEKKGNTLELRVTPDLGAMRSDVTKIKQVLLNLLSNAAKFTEAGTITLSAERGPGPDRWDWLTFQVSDTGIGMTEEQLAKLFQRFQQADASTTRKFGGTGLGLALTKAFSTMLGGDVEVESSPGRGSVFTVRLPTMYEEPGGEDPGINAAEGSLSSVDGTREAEVVANCVLVVDDDPAARDLLSRFLEREGFSVRTASDGRTGLDLARALRPRVILLDVLLPGMDGWSVLAALRADPELASIPVVIETVVGERGLASAMGAAGYLAKPIEWEQLKRVMDRFRTEDPSGCVLVVEDDPDMRERLRVMLAQDGWQVATAADGREALDMAARGMPSLVLLDLMMPGMDGFAFFRALRAHPGGRIVPVVVLTSKDVTKEDRLRLQGVDHVLSKAETSFNDLADHLRALLPAPPG